MSLQVTRFNLVSVLAETLDRCKKDLAQAEKESSNYHLIRDLRCAVTALEGIDNEIRGVWEQAPRGQRSPMFIRYVIDEGSQMVMDPELSILIKRIEDVYDRDF